MALSWLETMTTIALLVAIIVAVFTQEEGHWNPIVRILFAAILIFSAIGEKFCFLVWPYLATFICEILLIVVAIISYFSRR